MAHVLELPSSEFLHECLHLDQNDWKLYWKARPVTHFKSENNMNSWNGRFSNRAAGKTDAKDYFAINLHGKTYLSHRVIFFMHYGFQPSCIDHIDGNPKNNNPHNLRSATPSQNLQNTKRPSNNTSGVKGVTWHKKCKKWQAFCAVGRKPNYLGLFDDIELAKEAVMAFRNKLHGNFANHGETK
jgi:hypothetical protein